MPDVLEQLRHYGEAVEQEALSMGPRELVLGQSWWRRRPGVLLAAAAVTTVLALGGLALRATLTSDKVKVVATIPTTAVAPITTAPDPSPTTTEAAESTATTSSPATVTTTSPATVATSTTTRSTAARILTVRGTATWLEGRDARAALRVAACPVGNTDTSCGTAGQVAQVDSDGTFVLLLPIEDAARNWRVAAIVSSGAHDCAFNCFWRTSQAGPVTTLSDAAPPASLAVSVSARVVDVVVRDRNNEPFVGGGVFVRDIRCPDRPCESEHSPMFSQASNNDGAARIVVDPAQTYDLTGMAQNTGWANPQFSNSDGSTSWHSPTIRRRGIDIADGQVFLVDGAPS